MRQVRTATGKEMERIERVVLLTGGAVLPPPLSAEHPGLVQVQAESDAVAQALAPGTMSRLARRSRQRFG